MNTSPRTRSWDKAVNAVVELLFGTGVEDMKLCPKFFGRRMEVPQLRRRGGAGRVGDNGEYGRGRQRIVHELQPLARDFHAQARYAREITSWPRQAVHYAQRNGIATHLEDNRNRRRRRFSSERDRSAAGRSNDVHLTINQICCERR